MALAEGDGDVLVVRCLHGYTRLLQKMVVAYRALLAVFDVAFFIRADVDSVLPLHLWWPLLPLASSDEALVRRTFAAPTGVPCGGAAARWHGQVPNGRHSCQVQCAADRGCHFFAVAPVGLGRSGVDGGTSASSRSNWGRGDALCTTFAVCPGAVPLSDGSTAGASIATDTGADDAVGKARVYEYRLRAALRSSSFGTSVPRDQKSIRESAPFMLGTILYMNDVLQNDTFNPQWNNPGYGEDLGLSVYPPYPEASGYALSASVAAFLAGVGQPGSALMALNWKGWAIEDAALGTALAGLDVRLLQLPVEVRNQMRVVRVTSERRHNG
eukprot:TRINITY_DN33477_c0_g1_i1.p1 TRINITY_DN33477_c0_g1~~TRINITY_DN33477_c0_g1_i1.p1  ORF type:complete len:338 (-),score=47.70 TRINITY_DN33477_c0_g1_i1:185-1165(-)